MKDINLNRRAVLSGGGAIGMALLLAGCVPDQGKTAKSSAEVISLIHGNEPKNWATVRDAVNKRLKKDLGLTFKPQFINVSKYPHQALLKFTAGEKFDTALEALWMNMAQLQSDDALADLTGKIQPYPHLKQTLAKRLLDANKWSGHLWGIPQVKTAARLQHFVVREDLAEKYGVSELAFPNTPDYSTFERFLYDVKQKEHGVIPFGAPSNLKHGLVCPIPVGLFNAGSWNNPHNFSRGFSGDSVYFIFAKDAKTTGSSDPIPFWENADCVEALHRVRKYYVDGLINHNGLNATADTINTQWASGKYASVRTMTGASNSDVLPTLRKAVPGAKIANVIPLGRSDSKPNQTFQADNIVVTPAKNGNLENSLRLQDWLSVRENHDLLEYGIEGTDWKPVGDNKIKYLSDYSFPGYNLCWRVDLERVSSNSTSSETAATEWSKEYANFTEDPFHGFIPDANPVKSALTQMTSVMTQYANPLFYGVVDVASQLDKLKAAAESAGLDEIQREMEKQANTYLKRG